MSEAHRGHDIEQGENMSINTDKLALRRQSIRALTADELRSAHGGKGDGTGNGTGTGTGNGTGTGTHRTK